MQKEPEQPLVYRELATRIAAIEGCEKAGDTKWQQKHKDVINSITKAYFPSGNGISNCSIDMTQHKILLIHGTYKIRRPFLSKGVDFAIKVRPSLEHGTILTIVGKFGKEQDSKDMLWELFDRTLNEKITDMEYHQGKSNKRSFWSRLVG